MRRLMLQQVNDMPERYFVENDIVKLGDVAVPGLYVTSRLAPEPRFRLVGQTLEGLSAWQSTSANPLRDGMALRDHPDIQGIALASPKTEPRSLGLALSFAAHLVLYRRQDQFPLWPPYVVSPDAWDPESGIVRLPHMLASLAGGQVKDEVVWEYFPHSVAEQWLGGPLPDQRFFEENLSNLLSLRQRARAGQLKTANETYLDRLLKTGRYISIRFVYQHSRLMRELLEEEKS
jgi:hypothetical protein